MSASIKNKAAIFAALFLSMALQIGLSKWHGLSEQGHVIAALLIAVIMTVLVGIFFMGLKEELRLIKLTAIFPFILIAIMFTALTLDILVCIRP